LLAVFQLAPKEFFVHPLKVKLLAWGRRRRQRWMAVSQENLSALQQTFGTSPGEIGVLYNGIEVGPAIDVPNEAETKALRQAVRIELAAPMDARLLLTTARLSEQKGHIDLLRILPNIVDEFPDVVFVWAGDGPEQEVLETQIRDQGLQKHVRVLGYRTDIQRLVRGSDLFVFPSRFEGGCSVSIREAMAHRLPIVCSDAGGIPEVLQNGSHALMFKVRDTEGMLAQLRTALSSPAEMRTLAEQARQRILEFSSTRMIENYFAIFRDLCAEASPGEAC
jgi:glycosyltransferase involved in cell wall biosynthesis